MRYLVAFVVFNCVLLINLRAQERLEFSLGFADSLKSTVMDEQRPLLIYTPLGVKKGIGDKQRTYPVIYVLDGETNFRSVSITVERLVEMGLCPPTIVVGIPNTNRSRDLTPSPDNNNSDGVNASGGGVKFLLFIEKELIPYIDDNYPTSNYKLLIGHSLGGLMVMETMVHHKDLFNGYIAIDAALWWDNHKLLNEAKVALKKESYSKTTLFIAIANRMERGVDTTAVQIDTTESTELIRDNLELIHEFNRHPENQLRFKYVYYENDNHGTVPFIAVYDALRFFFDYYAFPRYADYQITNPNLPSVIVDHYKKVSARLGYLVLPYASLVNNLGYYALRTKRFNLAGELFSLNIRNYPLDANVYDSYGDYCLAIGDEENAINYFKKALLISEIPETKSKLNALLKKKIE